MNSITPVLDPLFEALRRAYLRIRLLDVCWSLHEMHPLDPARHEREGLKAKLERELG